MRNIQKILLSLFASFLLSLPLSASNHGGDDTSMSDIQKGSKELYNSFKSYTVDKKDKAVKNAKSAIKELDKNIEQFENRVDKKWDSMTSTAKKEAREDLRELRKSRNKLAENFGSLKASSADAWDNIKTGFTNAYERLANSWEKAQKEFNSKQ